jgi:hypothetical protein
MIFTPAQLKMIIQNDSVFHPTRHLNPRAAPQDHFHDAEPATTAIS